VPIDGLRRPRAPRGSGDLLRHEILDAATDLLLDRACQVDLDPVVARHAERSVVDAGFQVDAVRREWSTPLWMPTPVSELAVGRARRP
jgi:hypothetical protein